jgi:hypothetical protein
MLALLEVGVAVEDMVVGNVLRDRHNHFSQGVGTTYGGIV